MTIQKRRLYIVNEQTDSLPSLELLTLTKRDLLRYNELAS